MAVTWTLSCWGLAALSGARILLGPRPNGHRSSASSACTMACCPAQRASAVSATARLPATNLSQRRPSAPSASASRAVAVTVAPDAMSWRTTARPTWPVAPVTSTRILFKSGR